MRAEKDLPVIKSERRRWMLRLLRSYEMCPGLTMLRRLEPPELAVPLG